MNKKKRYAMAANVPAEGGDAPMISWLAVLLPVFVALGFPRQEKWLAKNTNALEASVFQDVGGSFDVLSGHVKRAPAFFINCHLEWLYRSLSNPKRIGRILQLPVFMAKSIYWKMVHRNDKTNY